MADSGFLAAVVARVLEGQAALGTVRLVAIDGPSGSGKSTLAAELAAEFSEAVVVVPTDHFATWDDPFDWWSRLESGVLAPLSVGRAASYLANDWTDGAPVARCPITFDPPKVVILEGVSSGRQMMTDRVGVLIWCEFPGRAGRLERAVQRDGESARAHLERWQAAEEAWFAADGTRSRADLTVAGD